MKNLIEIPLSDLRGSDVGNRAVAARDGNTFDGTLTKVDITRADYSFKDRPRISARITLKTLESGGRFSSLDTVKSELELTGLPLDYLIQIEREDGA